MSQFFVGGAGGGGGPGGLTQWIDQPTSTTMAVNTGYFATSTVTLTLPDFPDQGQVVAVVCDTAAQVIIQAQPGQTIKLSSALSSIGGTASNSARGDSVYLVWREFNAVWWAFVNSNGNWDLD